MSGSTAPLYSYPTASMSSHEPSYSTYAGPSVGDSNYLASSSSAFPSNQFTQPGPSQGETTPGSKRPFPWASGSSSQERDKRARGSFTAPEEDGEDTMSTDESAYASAAESPQFNPRSPTRVDAPRPTLAAVEGHDTSHANSSGTSVPRIPTPAALRSSSPLGLLDTSSSTTSRPTQPLPSRVPLSIHALAESRNSSRYDIANSQEQPRNAAQLDLGWLTQQLDEALPPPRSLEPFSSTQSLGPYSTAPSLDQFSSTRSLEPFNNTRPVEPFTSARGLELYSSTRSLAPVSSSTPDPVPTHPTRAFSTSYGSGSVDSALPLSRTAPGRVPLPWVDIENEGLSTPDGTASHQFDRTVSPDLGASSPSLGGTMSPSLGGAASAASAVYDGTVSPSLGGASPVIELSSPDLGQSLASTFGIPSPEVVESVVHSESGWDATGMSGSSVLAASNSSVAGTSASPSTIGASVLPPTGLSTAPLRAGSSNVPLRTGPTSTPSRPGQSASPAVSPSTSGSSASTRTTPQGPTRRPLSLNLHLRGFPTSPTLSTYTTYPSGASGLPSPNLPRANSPTFSLGNPPFPRANSPTFSLANSPTFSLANPFPTSTSPRTSTFDLAVTPPGSALPSFVARMMEVDSPVRDAGGDGAGHAYSLLGSPSENNSASIDALRRFVENEADDGRDSLGASPIQALSDVAVGSYFPASPESERQDYLGQPPRPSPQYTRGESVQVVLQGGSNQHGAVGATQSSEATHTTELSQGTHPLEASQDAHPTEPSWTSRPSDLDSLYSRRLTESGVSFPSRPSDSGASLPSFRAAVSPEPSLNMGSRPGRVVRDMSWSFSDLFRPHEGSGDDGRPTSSRPFLEGSSEMPSGSGSETSLRTRVESEGRASVRNALTRAVGLARADGPPRLHLNALPRMTGPGLEQQDEQRPTNLSRTPPALGPTSHAGSSLSESWFEESARPRPQSLGRRTSATRWTDLLPEATPAPSRPRMPPISTDVTYAPPNGMSWDRNSVPYIDSSLSTAQTPQDSARDAAAALARYQTFAQSIEEIRHSPSQLYSNQRNSPAISSTATAGLNSGRASASLGLDETSARTHWAPRREPVPLDQPQRTRNTYGNPYALPDNHHPPAPPRPLSESFESRPADGNWLREWEAQRDRRSRAAREDYFRRRNPTSSNNSTPSVELGPPESSRRPHPLTQLNDQTQGQMWAEFNPRPRPITRASLVATGLVDEDLASEWPSSNQIFPPPRRPEILPPRTEDVDASMRFSSGADDDGMGGMLFTDSPPSMLEEPEESPYELSNVPFPQSTAPSEYDPSDFRNAGHALRTSLAEASRRGPSPPHDMSGSLGRRSLGVGTPMRDQPERTRLAAPRDRWDSSTTRPYLQLERVRQMLRSSESREESRRHPSDLGQSSSSQPRRSSFLSGMESSSAFSSESTSSMRRSSVPWARTEPSSAIETHAPRPFPPRESDPTEWPSTEASSRSSTLTHELMRASSVRRRRRTLLPESSSRRDSHGFLNSVNNALHQVESGLLHINRELNALANDEPSITPSARMDWAYDQIEHRPPTPPPRLPPFNFSSLQQNSDWPASRRNPHEPEPEPPRRGPDGYSEPRQNARNYDYSWRNEGLTSEAWSNDGTGPSMPLRDRLLFRASAHPPPNRSNSIGSAFLPQAPTQLTPPTFARLHRRRPSPPAPSSSTSTSTAASLLRPFASQTTSTSPPNQRSYTSRLSHLLPRRTSGRAGGGAGSGDDNEDWHHPAVDQSSTRRFFIRARGRPTRGGPVPSGDFMRDEEFDDSYEGLLRLAARIGDAKPRGTPAEVIRSMPCCSYAEATGAEKETRCPICLDDYAQEDVVSMIKQCAHWFHRECIQQWLSNSRTCPVCRGQADGEGESNPEPRAGPSSGVPENHWT